MVHRFDSRSLIRLSLHAPVLTTTMSQYQPNAAPGRSFIEKINLKFSNLAISSSASTYHEKDGNADDETLIHNAFVNFFDKRGEPYPEWLGVKTPPPRAARSKSAYDTQSGYFNTHLSNQSANYSTSQYQPVRASYNSVNLAQSYHLTQSTSSHNSSEGEEKTYTRRSNSRLQEMYNKSRQNSALGYSSQGSAQQAPSASRANSSQRLRDRVLNGQTSQTGPSWGAGSPR